MVFEPPQVLQFAALLIAGTLFVFAIGARIFLPGTGLTGIVRQFFTEDWKYLGIAWIVTQAVNEISKYHVSIQFTDLIYAIEGERVAMFQAYTHPWLTLFFAGVYFVGFPFIVLFTYFVVKDHSREEARRYVAGYLTTTVLAVPFFVFFPVGVSAARADVAPLIYDVHPIITAGTLSTDTLLKAFPSLHTGLSVLAALYGRRADRFYGWTVSILAGLVVLSTFYGGIHWLSDAVIAVLLAVVAHRISRRIRDPAEYVTAIRRQISHRLGEW
ncbi:MAG: phosphatase PAP2 family protein [Halobacteriaceae archaeon]